MSTHKSRTIILLVFLSVAFTTNAQIKINWKHIESKPLSLPIGEGGPENYKEEVGGYDLTIDLTSNPLVKPPYTIELSFYRERDSWHPTYTEKQPLVDWSKLVALPITVNNYDNTICTGAWSSDPNQFKEVKLYTLKCKNKKTTVFVPTTWRIGLFPSMPADAESCVLNVRCYLHINVYSNNQCLFFNWTSTPYITLSYDFCTHGNTYKELGVEDLSSLFDEEPIKQEPITTVISATVDGYTPERVETIQQEPITTVISATVDGYTPEHKSPQHRRHNYKLCSVKGELVEGVGPVFKVYPERIELNIGDVETKWKYYTNDSISFGYILDSPSHINEKLWMAVMKGLSEQQFDNPTGKAVTSIKQEEWELFAEAVDSIMSDEGKYNFEYNKGIPNDILMIPTEKAGIGEVAYIKLYYVYVYHTYCCTCGEEHTYKSHYRFHSEESAKAFLERYQNNH